MSCTPYQALIRERDALLQRINPNGQGTGGANCPETADALNDFLNSGRERLVRTASSEAIFRFPRLRWQVATLAEIAQRLANCNHVVVRGTRVNPPAGVTADHYFVLFKVNGQVYAADALTWEVSAPQAYVDAEPAVRRMVRFAYVPRGYNVTIDDPLARLGQSLSAADFADH